jgi:hypothetical protein
MPSHLIYICADAAATNTVTKEFKIKGLLNLTVGRLSQIHIFSKPYEPQFAYGGYKSNIEAFVAATIRKQKLLTNQEEYPFFDNYIPTVPLPLPQVICKLKSNISTDQVTKILEKWQLNGMNSVDIGKGGPAFEIMEPSWKIAFSGLKELAQPQCARVDKRAQVEDLQLLKPVYQFIDGFLATNTYPYKKQDFQLSTSSKRTIEYLGKHLEMRTEDSIYREGYGSNKLSKVALGEEVARPRKVGSTEVEDLTPNIESEVTPGNTVFVAKPSPLPSSTSWGSPASVPNLGGLVFPYFPGMLIYDLPGTRDLIGRYIFRNLGAEEKSSREAYTKLRSSLGSTMNTPQGLILGHVLKGIELSLDAQAQLYLLFDQKLYLGFCLLGDEFRVWAHGGWREARSRDELRADLKEITTADLAAKELLELLKGLSTGIETAFVESLEVKDVVIGGKLLHALGKLEEVVEIEPETRANIVSLIGRCNIPSKYRAITTSNLKWAIEELTVRLDAPISDEEAIYIPATDWSSADSKVYKVLASFGPRSFSLRNSIGEEVTLLSTEDTNIKSYKFLQMRDKTKEMFPFVVYTKTIRECIKDWERVVESGKVKMDFVERAGGIRGSKFYAADKGAILKAFSDAIVAKKFVSKKEATAVLGKRKAGSDDKEPPIDDSTLDGLL